MGLDLPSKYAEQQANDAARDLELKELRRLLAMIVLEQGGELQISRKLFEENADELELEYTEDPANRSFRIRARKRKPGIQASDCRMKRNPADGLFEGIWSGYQVSFSTSPGCDFEAKTENGIRGTAPCIVRVKNGEITVQPK